MENRFLRKRTAHEREMPSNTGGAAKTIFAVFAGLMVLVYCAMGLYLVLKKNLVPNIGPELNIALGVMLIVYAVFRGLRLFRSLNN